MVVHLITNASLLNGAGSFQNNVNTIHSLGNALPFIEWGFIFGPIIFHAVVGVWIARSGKSNLGNYKLANNRRYVWQRITGMIAIAFIFSHVFHLHGWFHADWWVKNVAEPLGMAQFRAYNAASTLARAMNGAWIVWYIVGVLSSVFHLANGVWTAGITWGIWLTPKAQRNAQWVTTAAGILLAIVSMATLARIATLDADAAQVIEDKMYQSETEAGRITPNPHKRIEVKTEERQPPEMPVNEIGMAK